MQPALHTCKRARAYLRVAFFAMFVGTHLKWRRTNTWIKPDKSEMFDYARWVCHLAFFVVVVVKEWGGWAASAKARAALSDDLIHLPHPQNPTAPHSSPPTMGPRPPRSPLAASAGG